MKRRAPTIWALVALLVLGGLAYNDYKHRSSRAASAASQKKDEAFKAASDKSKKQPEEKTSVLDAPLAPAAPVPGTPRFHTMPDGSPVPALKDSAPKRVKLGVALFRYQGAQGTSDSTRSRESALALAQEAIKLGAEDFAAAVKKGDRGSSENIGWMKQRILERSVEYAVFNLEKGEISKEPIDTPRGFWVAKRLR